MNTPGFVPGPAIKPASSLLAWLDANRGRRVRLPVVVRFADAARLEIREAFIAAADQAVEPDSVRIALDDTGLGIPLLYSLRGLAGEKMACAVWLEGTWGPLVDAGPQPPGNRGRPFAVLKVVGRIDAPPARDEEVRILVAGSPEAGQR